MKNQIFAVLGVVALSFGLAACGSDDRRDDNPEVTTTETRTETTSDTAATENRDDINLGASSSGRGR